MNKNTPRAKGIRTGLQAVGGFIVGLFTVVWAVPGVPEAVTGYLLDNWLAVVASFGISTGLFAGLASWLQNRWEDRQMEKAPTYEALVLDLRLEQELARLAFLADPSIDDGETIVRGED